MARIVLVSSSFLPRLGGVEEHVANVAVALRDMGHEIAIWTVDQGDEGSADFEGMPLRYLPTPLPARNLSDVSHFAIRAPGAAMAWLNALRKDRPDFLHVHCFGPNGVYATQLASLLGRALVFSHHGETFMDANDVFQRSALLRRSLRAALARAVAVTSCSHFAAQDLQRFGKHPAEVDIVFNGIDIDEASAGGLSLPERYFLGVGRLVHNKGFDRLVAAYSSICNLPEMSNTSLVIGGDGPARTQLQELSLAEGVGHRVHFLGALSRPQVGQAMRNSLGLVVPSLVEPFGITILEGWRAAVPVIATNRGGPPEFVVDQVNGLLVDPLDTAALAQRLLHVATDARLRSLLGANGARTVQDFTWEQTARHFERIYSAAGLI